MQGEIYVEKRIELPDNLDEETIKETMFEATLDLCANIKSEEDGHYGECYFYYRIIK